MLQPQSIIVCANGEQWIENIAQSDECTIFVGENCDPPCEMGDCQSYVQEEEECVTYVRFTPPASLPSLKFWIEIIFLPTAGLALAIIAGCMIHKSLSSRRDNASQQEEGNTFRA